MLLGYFLAPRLQDQAAPGLFDLDKGAVVRLVREVALKHALTSPLLLDQASQRRSNEEQTMRRHAVWPL
jgi:hypothetical protein